MCGRPRKAWLDQLEKLLKEDNVKTLMNGRACMKNCKSVKEAREVCQNHVIVAYPAVVGDGMMEYIERQIDI